MHPSPALSPALSPDHAPEHSPVPSAAEARDNATFEALMWALSRPGLPRDLPEAGEGAIIDALLDRECRAHAADPALLPALTRAGAEIAPLEAADHVFLGQLTDAGLLAAIARGSDLYPDGGATVVLRARIGSGPALRLTGPGVNGALTIQLGDLPGGFWPARAAAIRYPMGWDLFIIDGARVIGLPRSTRIEVL